MYLYMTVVAVVDSSVHSILELLPSVRLSNYRHQFENRTILFGSEEPSSFGERVVRAQAKPSLGRDGDSLTDCNAHYHPAPRT